MDIIKVQRQPMIAKVSLQYDTIWAIEPMAAEQLLDLLESIDIEEHRERYEQRAKEAGDDPSNPRSRNYRGYEIKDGVASLSLEGTLSRNPSSFEGTSTTLTKRYLQNAIRDPEVKSVLLNIDSPGGEVSGTHELGTEIFKSRGIKPIISSAPNMAASAALWLGAQANKFFAGELSQIGSIGVVTSLRDVSKAYENAGIKVHVITNEGAKFKGIGRPGRPISEEDIAHVGSMCTKIGNHFISNVAKGRSLDQAHVQKLATGEVWLGEEAVKNGLVDGIRGSDEAWSEARDLGAGRKSLYFLSNTTTTGKDTDMDKNQIAAALRARGMNAAADAVLLASDDGNAIASAIASGVEADAIARAPKDPLVEMLATHEVRNPDQLTSLLGEAARGRAFEGTLREECRKNAIIFLGQVDGEAEAENINALPFATLQRVNNTYKSGIIKLGLASTTPDPNTARKTAPGPTGGGLGVDATQEEQSTEAALRAEVKDIARRSRGSNLRREAK